MILLFTTKINNRVQYIAKTLLRDICGFDYKVTNSSEEFLNFRGGKINYSGRELPGAALKVYPSGFLHEKGIRDFVPEVVKRDDFPVLFPLTRKDVSCDLGFDIFSSSFYQLSRYEEYLPFLEDRHGRFEADQSLAYLHGFTDIPVVDLQAKHLQSKLLETFPFLEPRKKSFTFIPTYDIDVAYAFRGKGVARTFFLFAKDIFTFNFSKLRHRIEVISSRQQDPFDTYDLQLRLQKQYRLKPVYFFLCGQYGPKDKNISIHSRTFQTLVKTIGDYAETGVHPSYASNFKEYRLKEETELLSGILNRTIKNSRQHYLKLKLPQTYQNLLKTGIKNDFSMGFASHTGFRAGTCTPFNFFDLSMETETRLKLYPTAIMDGTLRDYMKFRPEEALAKTKEIVDAVKSVDGTLITLWHNDSLNDQNHWTGWRKVYLELIKYIQNEPNP
ncbi:MAG: hypothetical protein EA361_04170 [Bacteroidetes bacterium]|nr:MAG: hypothetical protein EA361_04170 [Bacteroidota bacterium]